MNGATYKGVDLAPVAARLLALARQSVDETIRSLPYTPVDFRSSISRLPISAIEVDQQVSENDGHLVHGFQQLLDQDVMIADHERNGPVKLKRSELRLPLLPLSTDEFDHLAEFLSGDRKGLRLVLEIQNTPSGVGSVAVTADASRDTVGDAPGSAGSPSREPGATSGGVA